MRAEGDLPVAPLGTAEGLLIGEWAVAIGNPFANYFSDAEPTVTIDAAWDALGGRPGPRSARFAGETATDEDNLRAVEGLVDTGGGTARVARLREYDPEADGDLDVPDPYFGGPEGFENVHDMVERSTRALLERIRKEHGF